MVDKDQRGGGREIYIMDLSTKLFQQPIEKMMEYLCKQLKEEYITVPSNKRADMIHSLMFELNKKKKADDIIIKLTLDNTKWSPKCNVQKWIHLLEGMSDILPDEFIQLASVV